MSDAERRTLSERRVLRWSLALGAALAGIGLAGVHWLGIAAGGALVGLFASTVPRGAAAGAAFGLSVWLVFAGTTAAGGDWGAFLATGELAALSGGIAVGLGAFGGLARGLR